MIFENKLAIYDYIVKAPLGIIFKSKSILIKTENDLVIISPGDFDANTIKTLKESKLNKVFIAPNNFHNINLKTMKELFPNASFFGPRRSEKSSGVKLTRSRDLSLPDDIITIDIEGNYKLSETCFFHSPSKTLILTDLVFNMKHEMNLASKLMFKCAGTYHRLAISRLLKMTIDDETKFYNSFTNLLNYPFEKIIVNHGDVITRSEFKLFIETL